MSNKSDSTYIQFFQLNCGKQKTATEELTVKLQSITSKFIVLAQEPHSYAKNWCGIPNQISKHYPISNKFRTGILHSPDLYIWNVPQFTNRDITTCLWKTRNITIPQIYLVSTYWDGSADSIPLELRQALDFFIANHKDFILSIDTNAHSQLWGYNRSDNRGEIFEDIIFAYNLHILNTGTTETFFTKMGKSIIDITLCSPNLSQFCSNWSVSLEHSGSDHRLISFELDIKPPVPELKQNLSKCNWTLVRQHLLEIPIIHHDHWSENLIDQETTSLTNFITTVVDKICPPRPMKYKIKLTQWDESLTTTRRAMRKSWHRVQKHNTTENWEKYTTARKIHTKAVRKFR
jgi:hypothetical protein